MSETVIAWHFTRLDGTTGNLTEAEEVGRWYSMDGEIVPCQRGFHGSIRANDALYYASGPLVRRTEHRGTVVHDNGDKLASSERRVLWTADATDTLFQFACDIAWQALEDERARGREPDARSWAAIEARRGWLRGEVTDEQLSAAWSAARPAAWSAALWAARSAALSAAESAAWSAAWSVAWSAAWSAALWAAESAAWSAARSAAWSAAESAAKSAANERLERMLLNLAPVTLEKAGV